MNSFLTVEILARQLALWDGVESTVVRHQPAQAAKLLRCVADLPVVRSRSTRTLGCYVSRHAVPLCIRLQFKQEALLLQDTFIHEIAHLLDHLTNFEGRPYRGAHRVGWQCWVVALGGTPCRSAQSDALKELHQQRLKIVAVCTGCGKPVYRVRCLNWQRCYRHRECGGLLRIV